jgi:NADH-quinone oxidoreductase subunit C
MAESEFAQLKERFDYLSERQSADHSAVNCPADRLVEFCIALRNDLGFDLLVDVTAVDWDAQSPRFTGIYHLLSTTKHEYLRIAADCADDIKPSLPSLCEVFAAANWHERETYDLMGIHYDGHPDLRPYLDVGRISLPPLAQGLPTCRNRSATTSGRCGRSDRRDRLTCAHDGWPLRLICRWTL